MWYWNFPMYYSTPYNFCLCLNQINDRFILAICIQTALSQNTTFDTVTCSTMYVFDTMPIPIWFSLLDQMPEPFYRSIEWPNFIIFHQQIWHIFFEITEDEKIKSQINFTSISILLRRSSRSSVDQFIFFFLVVYIYKFLFLFIVSFS